MSTGQSSKSFWDKAKDTLRGGASGAQLGSIFGSWGTVVGGALGGIAGFFGSSQESTQDSTQGTGSTEVKAPTAPIDPTLESRSLLADAEDFYKNRRKNNPYNRSVSSLASGGFVL